MTWTSDGQRFSEPGNDSAVMAAWERFLDGSGRPDDALRSLVEGSWLRCREHNVDPDKRSAPPPVAESRLESLRNTHAELVDASAPVMACARDFLAETGTVMALADTRCTILSMEGDTRTLGAAENIHLLPGVAWSERVCGTNAIGTALAVGEPVQIHSAEHYCAGIKRWTCSATVIRHPSDGEILGVVDVSGLSETYNRQSLALVVTTANRIESRLAMRETELRLQLLEAALPYWSSATDSVVLFDRRGYPIKANGNAQAVLAALGADLDLSRPRRMPALALDGDMADLPPWLRPEWLAPVTEGGERIGTLLILSLPSLARTRKPAPEAAERPPGGFEHIVTGDPGLRAVVRKAGQLAGSPVPVLLLGETGVGKEEFAQGLHRASPFADGPFVPLNCGGLSRELLASELFGYVDGAFTGARRGGLIGKIEAANGGTLFLDEIGEMSMDLQPHLLRVLEHGEIYRLGENAPRRTDFRLVAATNRDLRQDVAAGRFRMDLYYRVAVTSIRLPALRDRPGDIALLVRHFLAHFAERHGRPLPAVDDAVLERLVAYAWPGNVRELRNVVENMLLVCDGDRLTLDILPPELEDAASPMIPGTAAPAAGQRISEVEADLIRRTIAATGGNLTRAADRLAIAKSTLYQKLKDYGLYEEVSLQRGQRLGCGR
ncbi:sigma-54-dependent Fis family transcriptional regulator [Pseudothauera rhizosphaerae]|uniref:Sigma-54-dependent Fis family transcriptional regulator n=1 Tax=Pseudothauera rhizosphaerae TaxID=2565932 RepID=A0A4V3WAQ1_9RHOO|nr:sigma-54-dependent Fis family transcriptional regulator [Pseudothauera rhizosphaerae]THF60200.1 sigma-54-dependent Fis family transcriptional regulator [Pseudothauera rhizosphaerae]